MKSHVPEENLGIYRYWKNLSRDADSIGDTLSGMSQVNGKPIDGHALANQAWCISAILNEKAQTYRADID